MLQIVYTILKIKFDYTIKPWYIEDRRVDLMVYVLIETILILHSAIQLCLQKVMQLDELPKHKDLNP